MNFSKNGQSFLVILVKQRTKRYQVNLKNDHFFGGMANKFYESTATYNLDPTITVTNNTVLVGVPTYGFGAAIYLNRRFNLKISQTFIPGVKTTLDTTNQQSEEDVIDYYTQIGISYNL